jgi:hypothetical protein
MKSHGRTSKFREICGARPLAFILLAMILLPGCGGDTAGPETKDEIAVFGYLYVGETVQDPRAIFITRTMPVGDFYNADSAAVTGALVTLQKDGAGEVDTLYMGLPGRYENPRIVIESKQTYRLEVVIEDRFVITATTTTPDSFTVLEGPRTLPDSMVQSTIADSFPIVLRCANEEQIFLTDVYCTEEWQDARYVIRFGNEDGPKDYAEYGGANDPPRHIFAFFRLKDIERIDPAGSPGLPTYRISWYGDMMAFYGQQEVGVFSIDANYYNYLYRDHPELNGGITGGIGVFGSACRKQYVVNVIE